MYISKLELEERIRGFSKTKKILSFWFARSLKRKANLNNKRYLKEKNRQYDDFLSNINGHSLDKKQREIILSEEDSTLVIAGAGSGKSLTILGRILYLIKCGISPDEILCISFTKMASDNLKNTLLKCGVNLNVYTFHKLGFNILKNNGLSTKKVDNNVLSDIVFDVLCSYNLLDIMPDFNFFDVGDGDFNELHCLLSLETNEFYKLNDLFVTFINLFKGCNYSVEMFDHFLNVNDGEKNLFRKKRNRKLLVIAKEIYEKYCYFLRKNKCIDFNDMINEAINTVEKMGIKNYKYIIVDEYQDISLVKCNFLKAIKEKTGAKIMAVGDDFQSIYQFTGSNLKVFLDFNKFFPCSRIFKLEKTYRNSSDLLDIMGKFILKNKSQIFKRLVSDKQNTNPIYIYYYDKTFTEVLDSVLRDVDGRALILGRNNKDIAQIKYKNCMTVHKSKGLEADNVIIVNLENSVDGFPNKIIDDDLLKFVKKDYDNFPYAEERRLFYVAMTRTKNSNYLLVNKKSPSIFVEELLLENKNIKIMNDICYCPICHKVLVKRQGRYGLFYGCGNYPKCTYTKKIN